MSTSCPACDRPVDPLRAGHVAIFGDRFHYFCDRNCRERFVRGLVPSVPASRPSPAEPTPQPAPAVAPPPAVATERETMPSGMHIFLALASAARAHASVRPGRTEVEPPPGLSRVVAAGLARASLLGGVLSVCLVLAGSGVAALAVRLGLAACAQLLLLVRAVRTERDPGLAHPVPILLGGFAAIGVAAASWIAHDHRLEEAITFAGFAVIAGALGTYLVDRIMYPVLLGRARIATVLAATARRVVEGGVEETVAGREIRPGAELLLQPGDVVPADVIVVSGELVVLPWEGAVEPARRRDGDPVVAGAKVMSGRAQVRALYTGYDRAWARLTLDPRRRADVIARGARLGRRLSELGGLFALLIAGLAAYANGEPAVSVAMVAVGAYLALSNPMVGAVVGFHNGRGVLEALQRGVSFRSGADWDRTAETSIAAFCARSTLLVGEPEVVDLVAVGRLAPNEVLALAAGAQGTGLHPVALAIQRSAQNHRVRPDAVRSPTLQSGFGITAVASTGEALSVGSRALMLKERISVAVAEQSIAEIEAHGRQVLLVALAGKLVGVIGLQDGLRPGARAAVQQLLDAHVEPALLSGDSRETCEAIGRALDIEHVRPEIPSIDRAAEVERLAQGGVTVAVLGHPREDEAALGAAPVGVALASAGLPGEWSVTLASDDVRSGALGICLARRTRLDARTGLTFALVASVTFALAVAFGLLPPVCAPVATAVSVIAAALHARAGARAPTTPEPP
jgi:cation transport ATPase